MTLTLRSCLTVDTTVVSYCSVGRNIRGITVQLHIVVGVPRVLNAAHALAIYILRRVYVRARVRAMPADASRDLFDVRVHPKLSAIAKVTPLI